MEHSLILRKWRVPLEMGMQRVVDRLPVSAAFHHPYHGEQSTGSRQVGLPLDGRQVCEVLIQRVVGSGSMDWR